MIVGGLIRACKLMIITNFHGSTKIKDFFLVHKTIIIITGVKTFQLPFPKLPSKVAKPIPTNRASSVITKTPRGCSRQRTLNLTVPVFSVAFDLKNSTPNNGLLYRLRLEFLSLKKIKKKERKGEKLPFLSLEMVILIYSSRSTRALSLYHYYLKP